MYLFVRNSILLLLHCTSKEVLLEFSTDTIPSDTKGKDQGLKLNAYSQGVHIIATKKLKTQTWKNHKPSYPIMESITLLPNEKSSIEAGAKAYFNPKTSVEIKETLVANETEKQPFNNIFVFFVQALGFSKYFMF